MCYLLRRNQLPLLSHSAPPPCHSHHAFQAGTLYFLNNSNFSIVEIGSKAIGIIEGQDNYLTKGLVSRATQTYLLHLGSFEMNHLKKRLWLVSSLASWPSLSPLPPPTAGVRRFFYKMSIFSLEKAVRPKSLASYRHLTSNSTVI